MLEPDQWNSVLGTITGTIYRGTERISSAALLDLLEVGQDPVLRQKVAKRLRASMRRLGWTGPRAMRIPLKMGTLRGPAVIGGYRRGLRSEIGVLDEVVAARRGSLFHAHLLTSALRKATTSPLHRHIIAADFANCAQRGVGATVT